MMRESSVFECILIEFIHMLNLKQIILFVEQTHDYGSNDAVTMYAAHNRKISSREYSES